MATRNVAGFVAKSAVASSAVRRAAVRRTPGIRNVADSAVEQPPNVSLRFMRVVGAFIRVLAQEGWLFVDSVFPIRLGIWEYAPPDRVTPLSLIAALVSATILGCFAKSHC